MRGELSSSDGRLTEQRLGILVTSIRDLEPQVEERFFRYTYPLAKGTAKVLEAEAVA